MNSVARTFCLILCILLASELASSQVRTRKAIIAFSDGTEMEVTNWYWFYLETKTTKMPSLPGFPQTEPPKSTKGKTKTSNVLMLSMRELVERGLFATDMEISETQISSIEFKWDASILNKVIVSLLNGKKVEIPSLEPVAPYTDLYLEGRASVNGFEGDFEKKLSEITKSATAKGTIVAIRFR